MVKTEPSNILHPQNYAPKASHQWLRFPVDSHSGGEIGMRYQPLSESEPWQLSTQSLGQLNEILRVYLYCRGRGFGWVYRAAAPPKRRLWRQLTDGRGPRTECLSAGAWLETREREEARRQACEKGERAMAIWTYYGHIPKIYRSTHLQGACKGSMMAWSPSKAGVSLESGAFNP